MIGQRLQVGLRLRRELHARLELEAGAEGRSLNEEICVRLERSFVNDRLEAIWRDIEKILRHVDPRRSPPEDPL